MLLKWLSVFTMLLCIHGWTLNCSSPKTISDQRLNAYCMDISSNEKGDVLLTWISEEGAYERLEASQKTQDSSWSFPQSLTNWEKDIFPLGCYVNTKGDLFATWTTEHEDEHLLNIAEKIDGGSWNSYLNWSSSETDFITSGTGFDSAGNLIFIGIKSEPFTGYLYQGTIKSVVIETKQPAQVEKISDISPSSATRFMVFGSKVVMNKNGVGYAFWTSYASNETLLKCQRIVDNHFILEPETICSTQNTIYGFEVKMNENGDILVAYEDSKNNGIVITKVQSFWSEPFLFTTTEERLAELNVAIDDAGNMMVVWNAKINEEDVVKTIYKPTGQTWQNTTTFSASTGANWIPQVQTDGAGNFIVIWQHEQRKRNTIFGAAFSTATQSWSDPIRLSSGGESCFGCSYTFWAPGKGYIAWTMCRNGDDTEIQVAELFH